jgi:hypothetical protein
MWIFIVPAMVRTAPDPTPYFAELGMSGQSQVIVRGEIDYLFSIEGADGGRLVFEYAQLKVRTFDFKFVELVGQIRKRISAGCGGHGRLSFFWLLS